MDRPALRRFVRRTDARRVGALWVALTLLVVAYVYASQAPAYGGPAARAIETGVVPPFTVDYLDVLLVGAVLAAWTRRPVPAVAALAGAAALAVAVVDPSGGCLLTVCPDVSSRFYVFLEWTSLGPAVTAAHGSAGCLENCPHHVYLAPLTLGYALLGAAVARVGA